MGGSLKDLYILSPLSPAVSAGPIFDGRFSRAAAVARDISGDGLTSSYNMDS
jgi:hypothetical protein